MKFLDKLFGGESDVEAAEFYIRENPQLYRHYSIDEVQYDLRGKTGPGLRINLTDEQVVSIVKCIRDEKGLGPIADYNMPGYREE